MTHYRNHYNIFSLRNRFQELINNLAIGPWPKFVIEINNIIYVPYIKTLKYLHNIIYQLMAMTLKRVFSIHFLHEKSYNTTQRYVYNIRLAEPEKNGHTFDSPLQEYESKIRFFIHTYLYSILLQFTTCGSIYFIHVFGGQSGWSGSLIVRGRVPHSSLL